MTTEDVHGSMNIFLHISVKNGCCEYAAGYLEESRNSR